MRTPSPKSLSIALLLAALPLAGCVSDPAPPPEETITEEALPPAEPAPAATTGQTATATLQGDGISGTITFTDDAGGVRISGRIDGAPQGMHGFHIHEVGECTGDFTSAGGHFNPEGRDHGCPPAEPRHAGDLGNVEVGADGSAGIEMTSDLISLGAGANSVVGKAVLLHGHQDDCASQPSGDAGARLACGVIQ